MAGLISGLALILFPCCAPLKVKPLPPVLDQKSISEIVAGLKAQEGRVFSLFGMGSLMVEDGETETESDILIAGIRDPLRIKIEITHPWGRPLFDILIQESRINIISYMEKRIYNDSLRGSPLSRFFPGRLTSAQMWSLLRGYPNLKAYDHAISLRVDNITFLSRAEEVEQVMELYREDNLPRSLSFPGQGIEAMYSDYEDQDGIFYAKTTKLDDSENDIMLELDLKQMIFNEPIREAVFEQKLPTDFETVRLKGIEEKKRP
jgi:hypothetical protein